MSESARPPTAASENDLFPPSGATRAGVERDALQDIDYRHFVEHLPGAVYLCDAMGRIRYFNKPAVELWGREPELGRDLWCGSWRIYYADGRPMELGTCPMAIALTEGRIVRGEEIVVERPDGTRRNVLPFPSPIRNAAGEIVGAVNMLVDITSRKESERAVRDSEERLRLATATGKVGLWDWDVVSNHVSWTDSLYAMHGVTRETFSATLEGFQAMVHPDDRDRVASAIRATLEEDAPYELEMRVVRPDGKVVWLFANARAIRENGRTTRLLGAVMDITDRKSAEAALQEAKEIAEAANRSKDRFLAVLSHELRTPLTPVLMTAAAMRDHPDLSPAMRENVAMIQRNVELETKLIDDLLDLSRITAGKLRLHPQAIDLNDVVRHVCEICNQQIFEKGIRLNCDLDRDAGAVTADPARFQQVLWNVLKNAAKFTPENGEIVVKTRRVSPQRVSVEVRDNGAGIAPQVLPRIFDAFEQGDARITQQFGGLGLGLAISKALIELHDGTIAVHSDGANRGSTFTIELPSRTVTALKSPPPVATAIGPRPLRARLLVVEDHRDTAMLLKRLLGAAGYAVETTHSAAGALDLASSESFDLLISDIGLPDATGYELMQQIRARSNVKGIAMSGYGMDEDLKRSRDAGFAEHLVKPINLAQLQDAIRRILDVPV